jgi:hypothetical protein
VEPLEGLGDSGRLAVQIELEIGTDLPEESFRKAREVLTGHPGSAPVELTLGSGNGRQAPRFRSRSLKVKPDRETLDALQDLFGRGRVRLVSVAASHNG